MLIESVKRLYRRMNKHPHTHIIGINKSKANLIENLVLTYVNNMLHNIDIYFK